MPLSLKLFNSDLQDEVVFLLDVDPERGLQLETHVDLDPDFQRLRFLAPRSQKKMLEIARTQSPTLVIFYDGFEKKDFVALQSELHRLFPESSLLPVVEKISINSIRNSRSTSGVVDIVTPSDVSSYENLKNLILNVLRSKSRHADTWDNQKKTFEPIFNAIMVGHRDWKPVKKSSEDVFFRLLPHFDISEKQSATLWSAERLLVPWCSEEEYKILLKKNSPVLKLILDAIPGIPEAPPKTPEAFILRLSNWLAERDVRGVSPSDIEHEFSGRPSHLKHPSIRIVEQIGLQTFIASKMKKHG